LRINDLKKGLEKEIGLYKTILSLSRQESKLLSRGASLKEVFQFIPEKSALLQKIEILDESLKELKKEWSHIKKSGETLPQEIVNLLHEAEQVIQDTITLDEENQSHILHLKRQIEFGKKPINITQDKNLRARAAYGK